MLLLKVEVEPGSGIAMKYFQFGCMDHRLAIAKYDKRQNFATQVVLFRTLPL
jgi:hypothetical protein